MTTIYLARHATPDWSRKDIPYHLPPGPPLVDQGRAEAEKLGYFFREMGVRQLFVSPLQRCQTTAEIAAQISGAEIETVENLYEWQPQEEKSEVMARMRPVFDAAFRFSQSKGPSALVSHGGPISLLISNLGMGDSLLDAQKVFDHQNPIPPAGAWQVTGPEKGGSWQMSLVFDPSKYTIEDRTLAGMVENG